MISTKNERTALFVSTIIFALVAVMQLWRAFANVPLELNGQLIPVWTSLLVGLGSAAMACWTGLLLKRRRPLI
jgi:hypothetical protein